MLIGEVANEAGVGVETIRYYESRGLIARPKRPADGGYRSYPPEAVRQIRFIRRAQQLGFSLQVIGNLLAMEVDPAGTCADIHARAMRKREEMQRRIDDLNRISVALDGLIAAYPARGPARQCSILGSIRDGELELGEGAKTKTGDI